MIEIDKRSMDTIPTTMSWELVSKVNDTKCSLSVVFGSSMVLDKLIRWLFIVQCARGDEMSRYIWLVPQAKSRAAYCTSNHSYCRDHNSKREGGRGIFDPFLSGTLK